MGGGQLVKSNRVQESGWRERPEANMDFEIHNKYVWIGTEGAWRSVWVLIYAIKCI